MAWLILLVAGLTEILWASWMKEYGLKLQWMSLLTIATMLLSVWLLGQSLKNLPLGTAYACWTGIGAVGAAVVGIARYGDPASWQRLLCIGLIVAGITGLRWFSPT